MLKAFLSHFFVITKRLQFIYYAFIFFTLVAAWGISKVESLSYGEALYFSFITGLTVGYGDISPESVIGRLISIMLGIVGILFTGLLVATMVESVKVSVHKK